MKFVANKVETYMDAYSGSLDWSFFSNHDPRFGLSHIEGQIFYIRICIKKKISSGKPLSQKVEIHVKVSGWCRLRFV